MATIKYKVNPEDSQSTPRIVIKDINGQKKVGCECCAADEWLIVDFYPKNSSGMISGSICNPYFFYDGFDFCWCEGGKYDGNSGRQRIETNVGAAKADGVWTSSVNFSIKAHIDFEGADPTQQRDAAISVSYKGTAKISYFTTIEDELGSNCTIHPVNRTITIYATRLADGSYFEIM